MRLCKDTKKGTTEDFVRKAKEIFPSYDYSQVLYVNNKTHVTIICNEHGEFLRTPNVMLNKRNGCPTCTKKRRWTNDIFVVEAKKIHGDSYDYSKVDVVNSKTSVEIICKIHGSFHQQIGVHIYVKCGCPSCSRERSESSAVSEIKALLSELGIQFEQEKRFEWCRHKTMLPFDFSLKDTNILIEYDGEFHYKGWGNDKEQVKLQQLRDGIKTRAAKENGFELIRLSYKDDYIRILSEVLKKKFND